MNTMLKAALLATSVLLAQSAFAQAPADAPAGTTGLCNDGSYYSGATKKGACRGHKGVKDWYAATTTAAAPATPAAAPAPAPAAAVAAAPAAAAAPAPAAKTSVAAMAPAAGGGPGMVWVNTASNTYHCAGTKYYGKTKAGAYMSEADAKAKGAHADHGKACS
jgi:hypothetical protein